MISARNTGQDLARRDRVIEPHRLNTVDPFAREILLGVFATVAKYESVRRSERIKAGLARRKAEGLSIGRQPGARDHRPRKRSAYVASWEDGGARREAHENEPGG